MRPEATSSTYAIAARSDMVSAKMLTAVSANIVRRPVGSAANVMLNRHDMAGWRRLKFSDVREEGPGGEAPAIDPIAEPATAVEPRRSPDCEKALR